MIIAHSGVGIREGVWAAAHDIRDLPFEGGTVSLRSRMRPEVAQLINVALPVGAVRNYIPVSLRSRMRPEVAKLVDAALPVGSALFAISYPYHYGQGCGRK
jgi:hypothetical protein